MKKIFKLIAGIAGVAAIAASCSDISDLEGRIDNLESKIKALETVCTTLNSNVEALQTFNANNKSISSFSEKDGVYTILLSDGSKIVIDQGSEGEVVMPVIAIDAEGYWTVNGNRLLSDGKEVKATPIFGVDSEGYWTVKYSTDGTPERILNDKGEPVKAIPDESQSGNDQNSFFEKVEPKDDVIEITLKNGNTYSLPIIPDFYLRINVEGSEPVMFNAGEEKVFTVEQKGVAMAVVLAKPDGWEAVLEESTLKVFAPETSTKAAADSRQDIAILAVSSGSNASFNSISKIKVQLSDAPIAVVPEAAVNTGEATENSLTFTVSVSNTSAWYYMLKKTSEAAPTTAELKEATAGTDNTITINGLEAGTEYTLYVLPVNGEDNGTIAKASLSTVAKTMSPYDSYMAGNDLVIAGVTYNKATYGDATLINADAADFDLRSYIHQKSGVFFLDHADGAIFNTGSITEIKDKIILIGNNPENKATIKPAMNWKLIAGELVMQNIIYDMSAIDGSSNATYSFNNANATANFTAFHIDNCDIINIIKPIVYLNLANYGIESLKIVNSSINVKVTAKIMLFNFYKSTVLDVFKELVFDNNIVYNEESGDVQIFSYDQSIPQNGTEWNCRLSMCNNTFYNVPSSNGYIKFYQLKDIVYNKNIYYADPAHNVASYMIILYSENQAGDNIAIEDNIAYGLDDTKSWYIAHSNSKWKPAVNTLTKLESSPFESATPAKGIFVPKAEYKSYGAQR